MFPYPLLLIQVSPPERSGHTRDQMEMTAVVIPKIQQTLNQKLVHLKPLELFLEMKFFMC